MGAWGAPLAAGAFWAGLLAWDGRPGALQTWPAWAWLAVGVAILAASWVAAPGSRRGDPLGRAGLTCSDPAAVVRQVRAVNHFSADRKHTHVGMCLEGRDDFLGAADVLG